MDFTLSINGTRPKTSQQVSINTGAWSVPEELPIAFVFNRRNYAIMMGTPDDLVDFAIGFSLTEGIIKALSDIKDIDIRVSEQGADFRITITQAAIERLDMTQRRRNMIGSASCGLCGLESADAIFKVLPKVCDVRMELDTTAISKSMSEIRALQVLNQKTRSVHAAAWALHNGDIEIIREDVGRHNALDKLLGAMALADTNVSQGFVLMSSRCSYEIVEKAAHRGVQAIASVSGPTAFAIRKAKEANIALYAHANPVPVEILDLQ